MDKKKKILWIGDFATTGFGTVTIHVCDYLHSTGKYDITVLGTNYYGDFRHNKPYWVYPIEQKDWYGEKKLERILYQEKPDIIIQINDGWCVTWMKPLLDKFKQIGVSPYYILYTPVDSETIIPELMQSIKNSDKTVVYSDWAKGLIDKEYKEIYPKDIEKIVDVIGHGVNPSEFFPYDDEKRDAIRAEQLDFKNKFIVGQNNRNQHRKTMWRSMQIIKLFREGYKVCSNCKRYFKKKINICPYCETDKVLYERQGVDNSYLYLNCAKIDDGGHIERQSRAVGSDTYVIIPEHHHPAKGFPIEVLNCIYNGFDVGMTTTVGEGWGLFATECAMAGVPLLLPNLPIFKEIYPEDLVYWVKMSEELIMRQDNDVLRRLPSIESAVDQLFYIYDHPLEAKEKARKLREYLKENYTWEIISKKWEILIDDLNQAEMLYDLVPV